MPPQSPQPNIPTAPPAQPAPPPAPTAPPTPAPGTPPAPPNPNSQFDFILSDPKKKPKGKFGLPTNLPLPAILIVILVPLTILVLLFSLLFGGGGSSSSQVLDLLAQNREIIRVTGTYKNNLKDSGNLNIVTTTTITLTGQQTQFSNYIAKNKFKFKPFELNSHLDKTTDASLKDAIQNNHFDSTFMSYLGSALQKYQNSIAADSKGSSQTVSKFLTAAYKSNKVLLDSSQFNSAS